MVKIVPRPNGVAFDLGLEFVDTVKLFLIANTVQKPQSKHISVQIALEVEYIGFDRRVGIGFKCGTETDVCNTLSPFTVN